MYLISIIVPVYNSEKYLAECLDSIVNQSYKKLEIILVDDGSTDNSGLICDYYARDDDRIVVFHIENHGVSFARNVGIKNCHGDYLAFVDSDDSLDLEYIKKMVDACSEGVDLVLSNVQDVYGDNDFETKKRYINTKLLTGEFYKDCVYLWELLRFPFVKLFKRRIILDNEIIFDVDMNFGEDDCFNLLYYEYVEKYVFLEYAGYIYNHRNNSSLSRQFSEKMFNNDIIVLNRTINFLLKKDVYKNEIVISYIALECLKIVLNYEKLTYKLLKNRMDEIYFVVGKDLGLVPFKMNRSWKNVILNIFFVYKLYWCIWMSSRMINKRKC